MNTTNVLCYLNRETAREVLSSLNAAYSEIPVAVCVWEGRRDRYTSACGGYRRMENKECRGFKFCPHCGGKIQWLEEVRLTPAPQVRPTDCDTSEAPVPGAFGDQARGPTAHRRD